MVKPPYEKRPLPKDPHPSPDEKTQERPVQSPMAWGGCSLLTPAFMRHRQANLCELEASMVCILSSRLAKAIETLSQKQNNQTTQLTLSGLEQLGVYVYGFVVLVSL